MQILMVINFIPRIAVVIINDLIDTPSQINVIQFIPFVAWLSIVCALHLIQCQVWNKERLIMTTQWPWTRILSSELRFDWQWHGLKTAKTYQWVNCIICYSLTLFVFSLMNISLDELVTIVRTNASYQSPGHLLVHLW